MNARRGIVSGLILAGAVAAISMGGSTEEALGVRAGKTNKVVVRYGDLNIQTEEGTKKLLRRIKRAAIKVCGGYDGTPRAYSGRSHSSYRKCVKDSVSRAVNHLARNLADRAETAMKKNDLAAAEDLHRRSVTLHRVLDRKEEVTRHLAKLSAIAVSRGDLETAAACHRQSLALNEELGRRRLAAGNLDRLGWIAKQRGDLSTAENYYRRALAIHAQLGHTDGMANQIRNLGVIAWNRGDFDTAEAMHRSALALLEDGGQKESAAESLAALGMIARSRGDHEAAWALHLQALALNEELGRKKAIAAEHDNLWTLALEQNRLDEAEDHLRRAVRLEQEIGTVGEAPAVGETQIGLIRLARGDKGEACAAWGRAQNIYRQLGNEAEALRIAMLMKDTLCDLQPGNPVTASLR